MAHNVYANDREIASKSSDGKSAGAFPDTCFSPPTPPATGVPIPYANTCFAKDITNGSRSVFIAGKMVALEDYSYFSKSVGDDPATKGLKKGMVSASVNGRCYFQTWSPNVKIEGRCVTRHFDQVSHNHSNPSNTALFPFISNQTTGGPCKNEKKRIEDNCKPEEKKENSNNRSSGRRGTTSTSQKPEETKKPEKIDDHRWRKDHCKGVLAMDKKNINNDFDLNELKKQANDQVAEFKEKLLSLETHAAKLQAEAEEWAAKKAMELGAKAAGRQAVGTIVPGVGNAVMGLWSAYDAINGAMELADKMDEILNLIDEVETLSGSVSKMEEFTKNLNADKYKDSPSTAIADMQDIMATANPCLRARKCNLVPYENSGKIEFDEDEDGVLTKTTTRQNNVTTSNHKEKSGCCPGQTGHHLIPGATITPVDKHGVEQADKLGCKKYSHGNAPVVCVEGINHSQGSHGRAHERFDKLMRKNKTISKSKFMGLGSEPIIGPKGEIDMEDLIETAANSHQETFPLSRCSKDCIKAQLEDFYNDHCKDTKGRAVGKMGDEIKESTTEIAETTTNDTI